jgi:hypothetical protein
MVHAFPLLKGISMFLYDGWVGGIFSTLFLINVFTVQDAGRDGYVGKAGRKQCMRAKTAWHANHRPCIISLRLQPSMFSGVMPLFLYLLFSNFRCLFSIAWINSLVPFVEAQALYFFLFAHKKKEKKHNMPCFFFQYTVRGRLFM